MKTFKKPGPADPGEWEPSRVSPLVEYLPPGTAADPARRLEDVALAGFKHPAPGGDISPEEYRKFRKFLSELSISAVEASSKYVARDMPGATLSEDDFERVADIVKRGASPSTVRAHFEDVRFSWTWVRALHGEHLRPRYPVPDALVQSFIAQSLTGIEPQVVRRMERIRDEEIALKRFDPEVDLKTLPRRKKTRIKDKHAPTTISRRVHSLSWAHKMMKLENENPCKSPEVKYLLAMSFASAKKTDGWQVRQREALLREDLKKVLAECMGGEAREVRDRALLLFGFNSGGRRRSEIAGALFKHLKKVPGGYAYTLHITKTDPTGREPKPKPIKGEAAQAMQSWLEKGGISKGHIFRYIDQYGNVTAKGLTGQGIEHIVRKRFLAAGFSSYKNYSPHSLRAGYLTQASIDGVPLSEAMAMTGHASYEMGHRYYRQTEAMKGPAADIYGQDEVGETVALDLTQIAGEAWPQLSEEVRAKLVKQCAGRLEREARRAVREAMEELVGGPGESPSKEAL